MQRTTPNDLKFAPIWKRGIAFAIDIVIEVVLFSLLIVFLNWISQIPIEYSFFEGRGISLKMTDYVSENFIKLVVVYSFVKILVVGSYFAVLESSSWQATIGKKILSLKVGDFEGKRISFGKAVLRLSAKWLSGQILLIGYLMALFTERHQALHDVIAGTIVFQANDRQRETK